MNVVSIHLCPKTTQPAKRGGGLPLVLKRSVHQVGRYRTLVPSYPISPLKARRVFPKLELEGAERSTPGEASPAPPTIQGLPRLRQECLAWDSQSPQDAWSIRCVAASTNSGSWSQPSIQPVPSSPTSPTILRASSLRSTGRPPSGRLGWFGGTCSWLKQVLTIPHS